jgi:hypothetical protein
MLQTNLMSKDDLDNHIDSLMENFKGDIVDLTHAIGAVTVGRKYGWRVLRIVISNASYRKYQRILGLEFKSVLPEQTDFSEKSCGYNLVVNAGKFWDAVNGIFKVDPKQKTNFV